MNNEIGDTLYRLLVTVCALAAFSLSTLKANAKEVYYGKKTEQIMIPYGADMLFRFHSEVKTVTEVARFEIKPAESESPDYSQLLVKPRFETGSSDVAFILADGSTIKTRLIVTTAKMIKDPLVDFKPKVDLDSVNPNLSSTKEPMNVSELDLIRAMIRGESISGFTSHAQYTLLPTKEAGVVVRLVKTYDAPDVLGLIYEIENQNPKKTYEIDLRGIEIGSPNRAILAQIDKPILEGKTDEERSTLLRVIARPGNSKMILPFEEKKRKAAADER